MDKPIRILAADGSVVDLKKVRALFLHKLTLTRNGEAKVGAIGIAIIDALVAALSVPESQGSGRDNEYDAGYASGWDAHNYAVCEAAHVVEE